MMRQYDGINKNQLSMLAKSCPEIVFRFEYDEAKERALVSYSLPSNIDDDNIFWDKLFDLKRFFNESWPDNYPLFCENERLFNLSDRAETICNDKNRGIESVSSDPCEFSIPMSCQHNFSLDDDMNEFVGDNFEYSLAA